MQLNIPLRMAALIRAEAGSRLQGSTEDTAASDVLHTTIIDAPEPTVQGAQCIWMHR
jgi:hypothetical protein